MFLVIELSSEIDEALGKELGARLVGEESFEAPNPRYSEWRYFYRISFLSEVRFSYSAGGQKVLLRKEGGAGGGVYVWETDGSCISPGGYRWPSCSLSVLCETCKGCDEEIKRWGFRIFNPHTCGRKGR